MKSIRRKIVLGVAALAGVGAVLYLGVFAYAYFLWEPDVPRLPREVSEVLGSDVIIWVPKSAEPIQVVWRDHTRETIRDRAALSTWLCDAALPNRTSVIFGETENARGLLEMRLLHLNSPPIALPCKSTVLFYALRDSLPQASPE